jgi:hypothetical protein
MDILTDGERGVEVNGRIYYGQDAENIRRHFRNEKRKERKRLLAAEAVENTTGTSEQEEINEKG